MVITQKQYDKDQKKKKYEITKVKCKEHSQGDKKCQEELTDDLYAIVQSDTHYGAYYLITGKEKLNCSCPARVVCKHLKGIKNGETTSIRISRPSKG